MIWQHWDSGLWGGERSKLALEPLWGLLLPGGGWWNCRLKAAMPGTSCWYVWNHLEGSSKSTGEDPVFLFQNFHLCLGVPWREQGKTGVFKQNLKIENGFVYHVSVSGPLALDAHYNAAYPTTVLWQCALTSKGVASHLYWKAFWGHADVVQWLESLLRMYKTLGSTPSTTK